MAKAKPLAQLKDIHLPDPISWWPLAPGWYVLSIIILLTILGLSYLLYQKKKQSRPKKQALELLRLYKQQYERDGNSQITSALISELLRRVALVYYPRHQVASLHGDAWLEFLIQTDKGVDFTSVRSLLLELPFKPAGLVDLKPLFTRTELWIKHRRTPCLN